jgi:hypothetical protein
MQKSTVYQELEAMAKTAWLGKSLTEIDQLLKQLIKEGQITKADYRSLLEIYSKTLKKTY